MRDLADRGPAWSGTGFIGVVPRRGAAPARHRGRRRRRLVARARAREAGPPLRAVREPRGDARRRPRRRRPPHDAEPPPLPAGAAALGAGKHVVCEKPLALDSAQSAELVELAERSGLVHCTNFNIRFYPQVSEARDARPRRRVGECWNVHGGYLQDWLLLPHRLELAARARRRAASCARSPTSARTGSTSSQFVTGERVDERLRRPRDGASRCGGGRPEPVETFAAARRRRARRRARCRPRTSRTSCCPLRRRRARLARRLAGERRAARTASGFEVDGIGGSLAWDAERTRSSGSATATGRTRRSRATRRFSSRKPRSGRAFQRGTPKG